MLPAAAYWGILSPCTQGVGAVFLRPDEVTLGRRGDVVLLHKFISSQHCKVFRTFCGVGEEYQCHIQVSPCSGSRTL